MADEAHLQHEGNLRLATLAQDGLPEQPLRVRDEVVERLRAQPALEPYGPAVVLIDLPPAEADPRSWRCQAGCCITGLPEASPPLLFEDYSRLEAFSLPHRGPLDRLHETWSELDRQARGRGWRPRPYWRLALHRRLTPDGNLLPESVVSIFVES